MSTTGNPTGQVRLGEGVPVAQEGLGPIRDKLITGTYIIDDAQRYVDEALVEATTTKAMALDILNMSPNKTFRNAFISLVMEQVWPSYAGLAMGEDASLYSLQFDGNDVKLERQSKEVTADLPLHALADLIATSNQDMATYFSCGLFSDGKIPEICGDPKMDEAYYDAFYDQTELQITHTSRYFKTLPLWMNSPSKFIASGLQVLRTHGFGPPNLIDGVSANENITLTTDQHRIGVEATLAKSITPYYLPDGPLIIALNAIIADPATGNLIPDQWVSNGDPDRFIVFPKPDIVRSVNKAIAQSGNLPVQTGCPVFHSRVPIVETPGAVMPLPRSLAQIVLSQLDTLYYPQRKAA